ncbi:UNVERIFIED_CONTAM: hypothetical protein B566_EDAN019077 [Ephemera danica]|nr:hypothetical protein B566_EDAN019077 [Ephemera danica]
MYSCTPESPDASTWLARSHSRQVSQLIIDAKHKHSTSADVQRVQATMAMSREQVSLLLQEDDSRENSGDEGQSSLNLRPEEGEELTEKNDLQNPEENDETNKRSSSDSEIRSEEAVEKVSKPARQMRARCQNCSKYSKKRQCDTLSENDREQNFQKFWSMDWKQREIYVREAVEKCGVKKHSSPVTKRQQKSQRLYYLKKDTKRVLVCPKMFAATLSMNERTIRRLTDKEPSTTTAQSPPKVVTSNPQKKERLEHMSKFLQDLPKVESHYCRKSSSRLYLEPPWTSMNEVFSKYTQKALKAALKPLGKSSFTQEWRRQKLSIFRPRKDQCERCVQFKAGNLSKEEMDKHLQRKDEARASKTKDKEDADNEVLVLTVDVQAVHYCPKCNASALYYRTKLAMHNYCTYDIKTHETTCSVWDESEGGLNSSIFATLLIDILRSKVTSNPHIKKIKVYSDGCGYQNRCILVANALAAFSQETGILVEQYFLEKGHTQMEVDSTHASIEVRIRKKDLFVPSDFVLNIIQARKDFPYEVRQYSHKEFRDYSQIKIYTSIKPGENKVVDIRCLRYTPDLNIFYKLNYTDEWRAMPNKARTQEFNIVPLYEYRLPIKESKFRHLQELKSVIPKQYHSFYESIPHL